MIDHPQGRSSRGPAIWVRLRVVTGLLGLMAAASTAVGSDAPTAPAGPVPGVFALPELAERARALTGLMIRQAQQGDWGAAERTARQAVAVMPSSPLPLYALACWQARAGRAAAAIGSLSEAIDRGFNQVADLEGNPDLASLRADKRWAGLLEKARAAKPPSLGPAPVSLPVTNGIAWVTESNTAWDARSGLLLPLYQFTEPNAGARPVNLNHNYMANDLRQWWPEGTAAGNWGDCYDNRDAGHSGFDCSGFPQLTRIQYSPAAVAAKVHLGLSLPILQPGVTLGNCSAAVTSGPFWRSLPRLAYVTARGPALLYLQYLTGKLYVYPSTRDHEPGHNDIAGGCLGDVYPANTPYLVISQGSSCSDGVFVEALLYTLAALRPEVKQFLSQSQTLMPTLQMILRLSSRALTNDNQYLTGIAHPTVFLGTEIHFEKMVGLAHSLTRSNTPPLVQLQVVEEDHPVVGRDYFHAADGEVLFDTPGAIARIWRSTQYRRRLVVSAARSVDLNGRPLTYHWAVLRGDPAAVQIRPLDQAGARVEITLTWQGRRPIRPGSPLESNRIDLGAFVHNGTFWSAPGFITFFTLDNEDRRYDADGRILSVTYTGADGQGNYVDPVLDLPKNWRDQYHYDAGGRLTGWTRSRGAKTEEFTAAGELVVKRDGAGQPTATRQVRYVATGAGEGRPGVLEQQVAP